MDLFVDDPISCTNMLPNSNSNGNPSINLGLVINTYDCDGLNSTKECFVSTPSICSLLPCRPSYVCCCYYCKCCCKCSKCYGFPMVSIQSSYISPSKCKCSLVSKNLVPCSLLTSCLCSFNYLSCGDVIYATSCLCSLICPSYGDVICGTSYLYSLICPSCGNVICGTYCFCSLICPSYGDVIYGTFCLYSLIYPSCTYIICGTFIVYLVLVPLLALLVPLLALQMVLFHPSSFMCPYFCALLSCLHS